MLTWHPRLQLVGQDGLTLLALHSKHAAANSTCCFGVCSEWVAAVCSQELAQVVQQTVFWGRCHCDAAGPMLWKLVLCLSIPVGVARGRWTRL